MRRNHHQLYDVAYAAFIGSVLFAPIGLANPALATESLTEDVGSAVERRPSHQKLALLVGINEYQCDHIGNLNGSVNDFNNIKRLLVERFGFPDDAEHIRVLTDGSATREAILKAIEEHLIAKAARDAIVVFHYSGHGSRIRDAGGEETDGYDETIVPHDSGHMDPYPNRDITDDELNALLHRLTDKTPNVTFIFDSCHSGTAIRGAGLARTTKPDDRPPPQRESISTPAVRGVSEGEDDLRPQSARYALIWGSTAEELSYELLMDGRS